MTTLERIFDEWRESVYAEMEQVRQELQLCALSNRKPAGEGAR